MFNNIVVVNLYKILIVNNVRIYDKTEISRGVRLVVPTRVWGDSLCSLLMEMSAFK